MVERQNKKDGSQDVLGGARKAALTEVQDKVEEIDKVVVYLD